MFDWALSLHHCMFVSLKQQVALLARRPDIIVSDFASYAGFDIADVIGVPCGQHSTGQGAERQCRAEWRCCAN